MPLVFSMLLLALLAPARVSLAWPALPAPSRQTPSNLQARQVVAEAIAALGGDLYLQVNERSGHGRLYSFNSMGQLSSPGTPFWYFSRFPADERLELTKKRDVVYLYSGGEGWEITYKGVAPVLRKQLSDYANVSAHALDVILKTWSRAPGTLMLDQGINTYDQTQVESVLFTTAAGDSATVDFELDNHLPLRVHWRRLDPDTGGHFEESVVYGAWAAVGGIETPYSLDHYQGDQKTDERYFDAVSFAPVSASEFTPAPLGKHR